METVTDKSIDLKIWKPSHYNHFYDIGDGFIGGINLLSNATLRLDKLQWAEVSEILLDSKLRDCELFELLVSAKFLVPHDFNEIDYLAKIFGRSKGSTIGFSLGIVTSLQCNFRCPYCYQDHSNTQMSQEVQNSILAYVDRAIVGRSRLHIAWWGGEPLLQADMIDQLGQNLMRITERHGGIYSSSIISNCHLLTPKNIDILRRAKLNHLQVTIDGPKYIHDKQRYLINGRGTYDQIIHGLKNLIEDLPYLGITLRVNVSADVINANDVSNLLDDIEVIKENIAIHFTPIAPSINFDGLCSSKNRSNETVSQFIDLAQARNFSITMGRKSPGTVFCGAIPVDNWLIHPKGFISKCTARMDSEEGSLGVINSDGSIELNDEAPLWLGFSPFDISECRNCNVLPTCMGGCLKIPMHSDPVLDRCAIKGGIKGFLKDRIIRAVRSNNNT